MKEPARHEAKIVLMTRAAAELEDAVALMVKLIQKKKEKRVERKNTTVRKEVPHLISGRNS